MKELGGSPSPCYRKCCLLCGHSFPSLYCGISAITAKEVRKTLLTSDPSVRDAAASWKISWIIFFTPKLNKKQTQHSRDLVIADSPHPLSPLGQMLQRWPVSPSLWLPGLCGGSPLYEANKQTASGLQPCRSGSQAVPWLHAMSPAGRGVWKCTALAAAPSASGFHSLFYLFIGFSVALVTLISKHLRGISRIALTTSLWGRKCCLSPCYR